MKKILALSLSLIIAAAVPFSAIAAPQGVIGFSKAYYIGGGKYAIKDIKSYVKQLDSGEMSFEKLQKTLGNQLHKAELYADGIDSLNDIYGVQGNVIFNSKVAVPVSFAPTVENGTKAGASKWDTYLKVSTTEANKAQLLMYGTKPLNSEVNSAVNLISRGKYRLGTLYYAVDKESNENISLSFKLTDVASKDKNGTVVSAASSFKKNYETVIEYKEKATEPTIEMLGAKIRTAGAQGLRFGTTVKKDEYFLSLNEVSFGTLIAVTNTLKGGALTHGTSAKYYDCPYTLLEDGKDSLVFSGEITDFPLDGSYDTVNFTARSYIKYKDPESGKEKTVYAEQIVRSVDYVKSLLKDS